MRVCRGGKRSFKGWFAEFVLTIKKACAHDKKGFTSREKRFHLTSANSPLGFSLSHCLCSCARFRDFCLLIQALGALKDEPLRGCQCGDALGRVKALRILTLPYQKTNPDGVIWGGSCWRWEVRINIWSYGIVIVRFDGMLCRLKDMRFVWND